MSDQPPGAGPSADWTPSWDIRAASKIPVINQAERELLLLIEFAAPELSKRRLAALVNSLVMFSESAWTESAPTSRAWHPSDDGGCDPMDTVGRG